VLKVSRDPLLKRNAYLDASQKWPPNLMVQVPRISVRLQRTSTTLTLFQKEKTNKMVIGHIIEYEAQEDNIVAGYVILYLPDQEVNECNISEKSEPEFPETNLEETNNVDVYNKFKPKTKLEHPESSSSKGVKAPKARSLQSTKQTPKVKIPSVLIKQKQQQALADMEKEIQDTLLQITQSNSPKTEPPIQCGQDNADSTPFENTGGDEGGGKHGPSPKEPPSEDDVDSTPLENTGGDNPGPSQSKEPPSEDDVDTTPLEDHQNNLAKGRKVNTVRRAARSQDRGPNPNQATWSSHCSTAKMI
jgi:hypothetical protein